MNTEILRKCLDELGKENPKLDYVRGMLETLISVSPIRTTASLVGPGASPTPVLMFNTADASVPSRAVPEFVKDSVTTT